MAKKNQVRIEAFGVDLEKSGLDLAALGISEEDVKETAAALEAAELKQSSGENSDVYAKFSHPQGDAYNRTIGTVYQTALIGTGLFAANTALIEGTAVGKSNKASCTMAVKMVKGARDSDGNPMPNVSVAYYTKDAYFSIKNPAGLPEHLRPERLGLVQLPG